MEAEGGGEGAEERDGEGVEGRKRREEGGEGGPSVGWWGPEDQVCRLEEVRMRAIRIRAAQRSQRRAAQGSRVLKQY